MENFSNHVIHPTEEEFATKNDSPLLHLERQTLSRLRYTVCLHSQGLGRHLEHTAQLALALARHLDLPLNEQEKIWFAASVHDLGKIGIHPSILHKEDRLTDSEFLEIQSHTLEGHKILSQVEGQLYPVCAEVALSHHERWDGDGYPNRIGGDEISFITRIVSIADVYETITAGRPYRQPQNHEIAATELRRCAGAQFAPDLVEPFLAAVDPLQRG